MRRVMARRAAGLLGAAAAAAAATAVLLAAAPASAAAASLTVNPVARQVNSSAVVVSGTYSCTPTPNGSLGQISATLKQPAPGGATYSNLGAANVTCDGLVHPYSVTTYGSVRGGAAAYHVVLNAVPTSETVVQDGLLAVA